MGTDFLYILIKQRYETKNRSIVYFLNYRIIFLPMQKIPVEIFSKRAAHAVQRDRINAAIGKCQAEAKNPEIMPKCVVILLGGWVDVKP